MRLRINALPHMPAATLPLCALTLALSACTGAREETAGSAETPAAEKAAASPADAMSSVVLEVTGGPHAGSYAAKVTEGGCSYGILKPGAWGHAYTARGDDPRGLGQLHIHVPDSKAAAAGTQKFWLHVTFGPITGTNTTYKIETRDTQRDKVGRGTATVDDRGSTGTVSFEGTTNEGVGLKGTIECHSVIRAGG